MPAQSSVAIPVIVLVVFIVFTLWILFVLISSRFASTNPDNPVAGDKSSQNAPASISCLPGQCATNLQSGFKTCPSTDTAFEINPQESVCNSRYFCDNPLTPFAVLSDGSTTLTGVCEDGVECPCLKTPQCADYILSAFTTSNGNPYQDLSNQRILFPQVSSYVGPGGTSTDTPPIQFANVGTTFCAAPISWLPLSNPGCNFVNYNDPNAMNYQDLVLCMGMISGCSDITGSPCLQGTLAVITDNVEALTQANIINAQVGCVRGNPCPCGQIAVYDTNYGGIVCTVLT